MKQLATFILLAVFLAACNNSKTSEGPAPASQPGVENVNGNVPDTTGSANSGGGIDSSRSTDSARK